jgi:PPE-repeat protein
MNVDVDPDWGTDGDRQPVAAAVASENGTGALGFAGTVEKNSFAGALGLTTLGSNEFGDGPRVPMVPGTWGPDASDWKGDRN